MREKNSGGGTARRGGGTARRDCHAGASGPSLVSVTLAGPLQIAAQAPDDFFMGLALEEAEKGCLQGEVPVGAVLVSVDGQVLSRAHNMPIGSNDSTAHAEVVAIRNACASVANYRLSGTVMYVTLEPCAMCVGAMLHARVRRLVFGARDLRSGSAGSVLDLTDVDGFNHHIEVTADVMAKRCADILHRFFKARRAGK